MGNSFAKNLVYGAVALSIAILASGVAPSLADDAMKTKTMPAEPMAADPMKSDAMGNAMKADPMKTDAMAGDAMKADPMAIDPKAECLKKAELETDAAKKQTMTAACNAM